MSEDPRVQRWLRVSRFVHESDEARELRLAIVLLAEDPSDQAARERLRALGADQDRWEHLAFFLAAEVRLTRDPTVVAALQEELAFVQSRIDRPPESFSELEARIAADSEDVDAYDRLARLYYLAGAWSRVAETLEQLATVAPEDLAVAALRAEGRLYRDHGRPDRALASYRSIAMRRAGDREALVALAELINDQELPPAPPNVLEDAPIRPDTTLGQIDDGAHLTLDEIDDAELAAGIAGLFDHTPIPMPTIPEPFPEPFAERIAGPIAEPPEHIIAEVDPVPMPVAPVASVASEVPVAPVAPVSPVAPVAQDPPRRPTPIPPAVTPATPMPLPTVAPAIPSVLGGTRPTPRPFAAVAPVAPVVQGRPTPRPFPAASPGQIPRLTSVRRSEPMSAVQPATPALDAAFEALAPASDSLTAIEATLGELTIDEYEKTNTSNLDLTQVQPESSATMNAIVDNGASASRDHRRDSRDNRDSNRDNHRAGHRDDNQPTAYEERKVRAAIAAKPQVLLNHLALVELLCDAGRIPEAVDHLRATIGKSRANDAELWCKLGDVERLRDKHHAALTAYRRTLQMGPDSRGADGAQRGLTEIAIAYHDGLHALVAKEHHPADVLCLARELAAHGDAHSAFLVFDLAKALGVELGTGDQEFLINNPPRNIALHEDYASTLEPAEQRTLIDDPEDEPVRGLLEILAQQMHVLGSSPDAALDRVRIRDARPLLEDDPIGAVFDRIASALVGPDPLLFASEDESHADPLVLLAVPPVVVVGPYLVSLARRSFDHDDTSLDAALRFDLGRAVELARPHRVLAVGTSPDVFSRIVNGVLAAFGPRPPATDRQTMAIVARLKASLPEPLRNQLVAHLANSDPRLFDPEAYRMACERAADRAGMIACGAVETAIGLAGGPEHAKHLVQLAASSQFLETERRLRGSNI